MTSANEIRSPTKNVSNRNFWSRYFKWPSNSLQEAWAESLRKDLSFFGRAPACEWSMAPIAGHKVLSQNSTHCKIWACKNELRLEGFTCWRVYSTKILFNLSTNLMQARGPPSQRLWSQIKWNSSSTIEHYSSTLLINRVGRLRGQKGQMFVCILSTYKGSYTANASSMCLQSWSHSDFQFSLSWKKKVL